MFQQASLASTRPSCQTLDIMNTSIVIVQIFAGIAAGGAIGTILGFSMASHYDVLRGVRPNTKSRLILFLARPTSEFTSLESVLFLFLMLVWIAVFFGLCAVPAIVSSQFSEEKMLSIEMVYAAFVLAAWFGRKFGAHAWKVIS